MKNKTDNLKGVWTALITPFNKDESIDWESFDLLIDKQIKSGVTGIVVSGTTGEAPTLTDEECVKLIKRAKQKTKGKCLIMAGTGSSSTKKSIEKTLMAEMAGADIALVVNPYYNKPTQTGLYLHFKAVAKATKLPIIIYNIKGRTGVNLETPTLVKLAKEVKNIIGVKEASGDLNQIKSVCDQELNNFIVLSGDDNITFKTIKDYGVSGVISVASNIIPNEMVKMVDLALNNKIEEADILNKKMDPLFKILFIETNPIPVKYALYEMKLCKNVYRLPMCQISKEDGDKVKELLKQMNIINN